MKGSVDAAAGVVVLEPGGIRIGPGTRRAELLAALAAAGAGGSGTTPAGRLALAATLDGVAFRLYLGFDGERLTTVSLVRDSGAEPGSWGDPAADRAFHDEWLAARLGRGKAWQPGSYPFGGVEHRRRWGTVGSYLIPQDLDVKIEFRYRR